MSTSDLIVQWFQLTYSPNWAEFFYYFVNRYKKSKNTCRLLIVSGFQNQVNKIFNLRFSGSFVQVFATYFENLVENLRMH